MNKKIMAMLMALAMIISMVPVTVMADEACDHNYVNISTNIGFHHYQCTKCGSDDLTRYGMCKGSDGDYDGICDKCGAAYKHTCDENGVKYKDAKSHTVTCSQCGKAAGSAAHSYTSGVVSVGADGHVLTCACGAKNTVVAGHNDANGDSKCDSCAYVMYTPPVQEHQHNYVAHSNNNGTHDLSCNCGLEQKGVSCLDNNGDNNCDSCGYVLYTPPVQEHEHNYVAHSNNDGTHDLSCNCGLEQKGVTCLDNNGDNNCDSCGYVLYTPPVQEHQHNYVAHSNNDGTHDLSCNCGLEQKGVTCLDNNGDGKCDSCGYQKYTAPEGEHEHNYAAHSNNDGTHNLSCNCGLEVKNVTCLDNNGDGKCDSCGYQKYTAPEDEHEHNYIAHSNNNGTHLLTCNCGKSVNFICLDSNGDGKCDSCGYQKYTAPEDEHEHNYIAHSNNNGTHLLTCNCGKSVNFTCLDSNGDGKCDSCGYQKYPTCDHLGGPWMSNDDGTHTSSCACGKNTVTGECQFIGDKCYMCGYEKHEIDEKPGHDHKPGGNHKPVVNPKPVIDYKDYDNVPKTGDILSMILAFFGF